MIPKEKEKEKEKQKKKKLKRKERDQSVFVNKKKNNSSMHEALWLLVLARPGIQMQGRRRRSCR